MWFLKFKTYSINNKVFLEKEPIKSQMSKIAHIDKLKIFL